MKLKKKKKNVPWTIKKIKKIKKKERNWRWKGRGSIVIGEWLLLSMEVL